MGQASQLPGYAGYTNFHWFRHCSGRRLPQVAWWRPIATDPVSLVDGTPFFFLVPIEDSSRPSRLIKGWGLTCGSDRGRIIDLWDRHGQALGGGTVEEICSRIGKNSTEIVPVNLIAAVCFPNASIHPQDPRVNLPLPEWSPGRPITGIPVSPEQTAALMHVLSCPTEA